MSITSCGVNENGTLTKDRESVRTGHIGDIITSYGSTAPEGTLICNGAEISRTTYAELFAVIGTTAGEGDGSTTFNLPDLRGKWMMGADAERAAGAEVAEGLPNITGLYGMNNILTNQTTAPKVEGAIFAATIAEGGTYAFTSGHYNLGGFRFSAALSNSIYGAQDHVTPASVAVLPCIIYQ